MNRVPLARPDITDHERDNVAKVMQSGWLSQGYYVHEAEEKLKAITGRRYAICTSSGTTALIAAILATANDRPRCHIVVPAFTFAAVHNSVKMLGHYVHYLPADTQTWQLTEDAKEYCDWNANIAMTAPCYGKVEGSETGFYDEIEDAAESFTGSLQGRPAGAFGRISCLGFFSNKIIAAGEGGALLTNEEELALKLRTITNFGINNKRYENVMVGFNGKMSDLHAAVLCAQLDRLPTMVAKRRAILARYDDAARGRGWTFPTLAPGEIPAPWIFAGIPADRRAVIDRCEEGNVEWRPFFPIPAEAGKMAETRKISESGICLPLSSALAEEEIQRVEQVIYGG